jgi:hypothetical protein
MRRWLWNLAAGASLLLFVAAAAMWVGSYWFYDEAGFSIGRHLIGFHSAHGDTSWVWDTDYPFDKGPYARRQPVGRSIYATGMSHYLEYRFAGFAARYHDERPASGGKGTLFRVLVVPYWFVLLVTAVGAGYSLRVIRRDRRRRAEGMCVGCGYDLRASVGRCPECGRPFGANENAPGLSEARGVG